MMSDASISMSILFLVETIYNLPNEGTVPSAHINIYEFH